MKKAYIFIFFIFFSQILSSQIYYYGDIPLGGYYECKSYNQWLLVFEDNFNNNEVDYSKWYNCYSWGRTISSNPEVQVYSDGNNFEFNGNSIKLVAKDEDILYNGELYNYSSGMLRSKQQFVYGKFEIRCKIPSIKLLWPAFWLYGQCEQEIDVFEFMSEESNPYFTNRKIDFTLHRKFECESSDGDERTNFERSWLDGWNIDMSEDFHNYSVEWDEQKIIWKIDGNEIYTIYKYRNSFNQPLNKCGNIPYGIYKVNRIFPKEIIPMSIIANLAIKNNSNADFPVNMEIDYIRVYQKINTNEILNICNYDEILGTTLAGQKIIVGGNDCDFEMSSGKYLDINIVDDVILQKNVLIQKGAVFNIINR